MFCPKCGKENAGQSRFCYACGATLPTITTGPDVQRTVAWSIPDVYAGFWRRFAAALLDGILINIVSLAFYIPLGFPFGVEEREFGEPAGLTPAFWGASIGMLVLGWLYYSLMESSSKQATLGKMALGIKVTDLEGNRISFAKATGRHFAKILSSLILLIGYIMIAFTEKKQGLHDMMAKCLVVVKGE